MEVDIELANQNNIEFKYGRFIENDGSVRPTRDTGLRVPATKLPFTYVAPPRRATEIPVLEIHIDDMRDLGPAVIRWDKLNAVRAYEIDESRVEARTLGYTRENIEARVRREEKENVDASKN